MSKITLEVVQKSKEMLQFVADFLNTPIDKNGKHIDIHSNKISITAFDSEDKFSGIDVCVNGKSLVLEFDELQDFKNWKENLNGWACGVVMMRLRHEFTQTNGSFNVGSVGNERTV